MKNLKARIVPILGIIALVAVIGFSMAACGGDDNGGGGSGGISWVGTWKLEGGTATDVFTLGAGGNGWSWGGAAVSTANGEKWEVQSNYFGSQPALLLNKTSSISGDLVTDTSLIYEKISSTEINVTSSNDLSCVGTWKKAGSSGGSTGGGTITYTATATSNTNNTTTAIKFEFSAAVTGLTADDITVTSGTGSVTKRTLTGSGTSWSLGVTVNNAGTVTVSIDKSGIESGTKPVTVTITSESIKIIITNLTPGTSYMVRPGSGPEDASGMNDKNAIADDSGTVTVTFTSGDFGIYFWGTDMYIFYATSGTFSIVFNGQHTKTAYKMEARTTPLTLHGINDFERNQ